MTKRDFEIFVAVVKYGGIKGASQKLFVSQPSISQAIIEIEKRYNVKLFERFSKQLYLTEVGQTFLNYASSILQLDNELESYLENKHNTPTLSVGSTVTIGSCLISQIISELKKQYPFAQIKVIVTNTKKIEEMLLQNQLDISIVEGHISNPNLVSEHAISDELKLICSSSHPLSGRDSVLASELSNYPLILREEGSGTRSQLESQLHQHNIRFHADWSCSTSDAIINAVINNHGISVISQRLIESYINQGLLWSCGIDGIDTHRWFSIVYHQKKYRTDLIDAFVHICKNSAMFF